ncbi:hypothetical protein M0802_016729 [Mischocyttarus mexicanus]|nr:hypothetical protein M0802_016729 [Mischocyttarus mexicanus]
MEKEEVMEKTKKMIIFYLPLKNADRREEYIRKRLPKGRRGMARAESRASRRYGCQHYGPSGISFTIKSK